MPHRKQTCRVCGVDSMTQLGLGTQDDGDLAGMVSL
jgi:hypothetical protein